MTDASATEFNTNCNLASGAGCVLPPKGPGHFYPYLTQAKVAGHCVWEFGNMHNGNTFGGDAQYGSVGPGTLGAFAGPSGQPELLTGQPWRNFEEAVTLPRSPLHGRRPDPGHRHQAALPEPPLSPGPSRRDCDPRWKSARARSAAGRAPGSGSPRKGARSGGSLAWLAQSPVQHVKKVM